MCIKPKDVGRLSVGSMIYFVQDYELACPLQDASSSDPSSN